MPAGAAEHTPLRLAIAACTVVLCCPGQRAGGSDDVVLQAVFAPAPQRTTLPAIAWLCERHLPGRPEWPAGLDPTRAFAATLSAQGLTLAPTNVELPPGLAVFASCRRGDGPPLLAGCMVDGTEDWSVPAGFAPPAAWRDLLLALDADALDVPRTLSTAVVVAHLAGGLVDGDPRRELLQLGASQCGDVSWLAWATPDRLRVRGRSDGGLALPAFLLVHAAGSGTRPEGLLLRAFAARDLDRQEAARQLGRVGDDRALPTLRALLHADDATRLFAIDALVRRGAADELPAIVAAAGPREPWATVAAADALQALWLDASPAARQRTREALARSGSIALRQIDVDTLPRRSPAAAPIPDDGPRVRALAWLALVALGLCGLWARERHRLGTSPG